MKVKLLIALTLLALIASSSAVKVRPLGRYGQKRAVQSEQRRESQKAAEKTDDSIAEEKSQPELQSPSVASTELQRKEDVGKDVHKRGIYYNGGLGYGAQAAYWPKTYAAHYGYNLNLPGATAFSNVAAHGHAHQPVYAHAPSFAHAPVYASHAPAYATHAHGPTLLKYPSAGGFHLKHFAAGPAAFPVASYGGSTIDLGNTAIAFGPTAAVPALPPTAVATLPHPHLSSFAPAVGAAVAPVAPVAPAIAPVNHAVASAAPVSPFVLRPGGAVVSSYNVNFPRFSPKPVFAVPHETPVQPAVAHIHPVQPVQPAAVPVQPVQPVHTVVQVQHTTHPFASVQPLHHFPHYFQTSFVPPQRIPVAVPAAPVPPIPSIPAVPLTPSFPAVPSFPPAPALPAIPTFPSAPAFPAIPTVPAVPATPAIPTGSIPTIPPTASANPNLVFPLGVQPPSRPQQTPTFVSIPVQPEAQFPPLVPLPGSQRPETGSAEAAPQIPNIPPAPAPLPEPELPAQGSQEPWKPILSYGPPNVDRPALTLLPPYGSSPGEAYLPPAPSPQQQQYQQQQQQQQQAGLFDNLSDSEIEHIFAQAANLAAQHASQQTRHRTFSSY